MQAAELAELHHNRGGAHKIAGRLKEAEAEFRTALALDPTRAVSRYSLGTVLLRQGQYPEGYALYESRHDVPSFKNPKPNLPFPEWRGEDVAGKKILIWPEQGFGDQIQSARFVPILKSMGAEVTLLCWPGLTRLFSQLGVNVVSASGSVEFSDPDGWVMCESLAPRLGFTVDTLPSAPYLAATPLRKSEGFRIGLATKGDPRHLNDQYRSLAPDDANRLGQLPFEIVGLHPEDSGARDFLDTAEIIAGLDLVISVDTSVAHLAGALGKECWILVPAFNTDWRWLEHRTDSPWYQSVRLFRQAIPGSWSSTIDEIAGLLSEHAKTFGG